LPDNPTTPDVSRAALAFRNTPIRRKLLIIIMVITTSALLLAGAGFVGFDSILFRSYLSRDLASLGKIVADTTTAAIDFDDSRTATEILSALRARPHLAAACIYRANHTKLAEYFREGEQPNCPSPTGQQQVISGGGKFMVSQPVILNGRTIGEVAILYDLGEIYERGRLYGMTVLAVLLVSSLLAFLLSSKLRTVVVAPVLELARASSAVSESKDYSIRAARLSGDELGLMVDTFNEMLTGIESRDHELHNALRDRENALNEARRVRNSLEQSNESLARSNEDLERFAFVASHDLQEPLRMITVYAQLLVKKYPTAGDEIAMYVQNITDGTARMRDLLADLLAFTEIRDGSQEPFGSADLNQVLEKVRANLKVAIEESGAVIVAEALPEVHVLESHLIPLFQNLVSNAIKYRGEAAPLIRISAEKIDGYFRFAVADNGIGIEPQYHQKIFGAFKRLHGRKIPGTGIGLAICQRVVERYRGKIWVESEPGWGSTFFFTLPADEAGS